MQDYPRGKGGGQLFFELGRIGIACRVATCLLRAVA